MGHEKIKAASSVLPVPESYWVRPGLLMAGEHPLCSNPDESHRRLLRLSDSGIRHIIDLTEPFEDSRFENMGLSYDALLRRVGLERNVQINRSRFPIPDFGVPDISLMKEILDEIDAKISDNKPVYIHCRAGIGRTGTVVGCYLVRNYGIVGIDVLDRIDTMRKNLPSHFLDSPQSREQIELVLSWQEKDC